MSRRPTAASALLVLLAALLMVGANPAAARSARFIVVPATRVPAHVVGHVSTIMNTSLPTISGSGYAGFLLVANPGVWDTADLTYGYQWNLDGNPIGGAGYQTYTPTIDDVGHTLTVTVVARNPNYLDGAATSKPLTVVTLPTFKATKGAAILGNAAVGSVLTATTPTWSMAGVTNSYQWVRNGAPIEGAKGKTYALTTDDAYKPIGVRVTGSSSGYNNTTSVSASIMWNKALPKISGKAKVGQRLRSSAGTWSVSGLTVAFQWTRNGASIKGATKSTYKLVGADRGKRIAARVTVRRDGYRTSTSTSKAAKIS